VCGARGSRLGRLESGFGRAANAALAALPGCTLPGCTLPGDISASNRYYARDTPRRSCCATGTSPYRPAGIGVDIDDAALAEVTTGTEWIPIHRGRGMFVRAGRASTTPC
jgi:O-succinylbenzoate synthase